MPVIKVARGYLSDWEVSFSKRRFQKKKNYNFILFKDYSVNVSKSKKSLHPFLLETAPKARYLSVS